MNKPQKYNPSLGLQGNIENSLWENQYRKNEISNEENLRISEDITNREATEQNHTDSYLDIIEAQQVITELTLKNIELEARVKALEDK